MAIYMASSGMSAGEAGLLLVMFALALSVALYRDITKGQKR